MATHTRKSGRKGSATANGRHRSRPKPAPEAATESGQQERADQEPPRFPAREEFVTPREKPGDSRPTTIDHADGQGAPPKSGLEFLWRVITDERALENLCRLMRSVSVNLLVLLLPVACAVYVTMPAKSQLVKAIMSGGYATLIGIAVLVRRRSNKGRGHDLTAVWRATAATCPIAAA
jgi:hypothetical protein